MSTKKPKVRDVLIDAKLCKGCKICIVTCPVKILKFGEKVGFYGVKIPEVIDIEKCINCGFCELYCPDFAVTLVVEKGKEVEAVAEA